ncbi:MAG: hypothetical protein ACJAS1_005004 [Oleiphilaceae bacterium]|jgi:hypothetical protein
MSAMSELLPLEYQPLNYEKYNFTPHLFRSNLKCLVSNLSILGQDQFKRLSSHSSQRQLN